MNVRMTMLIAFALLTLGAILIAAPCSRECVTGFTGYLYEQEPISCWQTPYTIQSCDDEHPCPEFLAYVQDDICHDWFLVSKQQTVQTDHSGASSYCSSSFGVFTIYPVECDGECCPIWDNPQITYYPPNYSNNPANCS